MGARALPADPLTGEPFGVYVCDDVAEMRALARFAIEDDERLHVVGEAGDGATAIAEIAASCPDVVLLDLSMPGIDGLEAIPLIRRDCPAAGIVVFSGFEAARMRELALERGADGYVEKGEPLDAVREVLREVAQRTGSL